MSLLNTPMHVCADDTSETVVAPRQRQRLRTRGQLTDVSPLEGLSAAK